MGVAKRPDVALGEKQRSATRVEIHVDMTTVINALYNPDL